MFEAKSFLALLRSTCRSAVNGGCGKSSNNSFILHSSVQYAAHTYVRTSTVMFVTQKLQLASSCAPPHLTPSRTAPALTAAAACSAVPGCAPLPIYIEYYYYGIIPADSVRLCAPHLGLALIRPRSLALITTSFTQVISRKLTKDVAL